MKGYVKLSMLAALVLAGCATPYQSAGPWNAVGGGFADEVITHNVRAVAFSGNGYSSKEMAADFALLRAAEVALSEGYAYFVVLKGDDRGLSTASGAPDAESATPGKEANPWAGNAGWGSSTLIIGLLHEPPKRLKTYLNASEVFDVLTQNYKMDLAKPSGSFDPESVDIEFDMEPRYTEMPATDPQTIAYRRSMRNMSFGGIQVGTYYDLEEPFGNRLITQEKLRAIAAEKGAQGIIIVDDPTELRGMGTAEVAGFMAALFLIPDAHLGIQWEPGDLANQKFIVRRFYPDSLGDEAGLRIGDQVLAMNGIDLLDAESFNDNWMTWQPGDPIPVTVVREGREEIIEVEAIANVPF